jgi:hypothetical protein
LNLTGIKKKRHIKNELNERMNNNENFKIIYTITEQVQQELQPSQNLSSATELRGMRERGT